MYQNLLPKVCSALVTNDINELNEFVINSMLIAAEKSIPKKRIFKPNKLPEYILDIIKLKNKQKRRTILEKQKFNLLKKLIDDEIKAVKNKHWLDLVKSLGKNVISSKPFWRKINQTKNQEKENKKNQIPTLIMNDIRYTYDNEKALIFGNILESTFSDSNDQYFDEIFKESVENSLKDKIFKIDGFKPFSISELNIQLKTLNRNSAVGHDKIHNLLLLNSSNEFKNIILLLINKTIENNILPHGWKLATITMI
ncbi:RNA-directed DNA polymerase from mobile element jockey-like, partial [Brachionus plicatilis]